MNQSPVKQESPAAPSFLTLPDGRRLAYHLTPGRLPGVVFLGGFRSDMTGGKALALEAYCAARGQRFLRFDYSGHGQSGGDFMECGIGRWKADALAMLDEVASGPNVLAGSSMGGWIMLLAALAQPQQVRGLVGIAAAPDFTERLIWNEFTPEQKAVLQQRGVVYVPNCYDDQAPYPLTRHLIEEGRSHLLLHAPIALDMPVRLLHGTEDKDVPWQVSHQLADALTSHDVALTLIKNGGHRLSEPGPLAMLCHAVGDVLTLAG